MPLTENLTLADLRREIDRLDEAMHDLLMERGRIIDRLIAVKKTAETGSAFRPAREAEVIRRLVQRHEGRLPPEVVANVWRQIISTFTHVQAPHAVHVAMGEEVGAARDLARAHFGFGVPLVKHSTVASVIEAVGRERGDLGLVVLGAAREAWWEPLGRGDAPVIMATTPVIARATDPRPPQGAIIAHPSVDTAGLDTRVVAIAAKGAPPAPVDAVIARAEVNGITRVLAWGPREVSEIEIARDVFPVGAVEAARTVGYTAKPVAV